MTPLNQRKDYDDKTEGQGSKAFSLVKASAFVRQIKEEIEPLLAQCEYYDSEETLGNAPTVKLPSGELAIAPDLKCTTKAGNVFWIEVKDKSQRFYHPDTGADLFQVYGWYSINKHFDEPVYVLFKDPTFESCLPRNPSKEMIDAFKIRWDQFGGKPYGGWLSRLLLVDRRYPRIFLEHSRSNRMYILYFRVENMHLTNYEEIINEVDSNTIPPVADELQAYYNEDGQLKPEATIVRMIRSLFS